MRYNNKLLYTDNRERMDYQKAPQIGAGLIGSDAIESAHRTVIQSRLKLSGQRWTKSGAQDILNIEGYRNESSMGVNSQAGKN